MDVADQNFNDLVHIEVDDLHPFSPRSTEPVHHIGYDTLYFQRMSLRVL